MKTESEIKAKQREFVESYKFPKTIVLPKMKALTSAINSSVRTRYYHVYTNDRKNRGEARVFWKNELERLGEKYKYSKQSKDQFLEDVYTLQKRINDSDYCKCFINDRIRLGQCQKSFSIYLKWMWCQGQLAGIPPVCPIDCKILSKCRRVLKINKGTEEDLEDTYTTWSIMDCRKLYERLVAITEKVARIEKYSRPCVWELCTFSKQ